VRYTLATGVGALLLLCACGGTAPDAPSGRVSEQQRIEALSAEVTRMGRQDLPGAACGPPPAAGRNVVVFATADLCLSCLQVGAVLRDMTRQGVSAPDRTRCYARRALAGGLRLPAA
jgi:hypothetical protein